MVKWKFTLAVGILLILSIICVILNYPESYYHRLQRHDPKSSVKSRTVPAASDGSGEVSGVLESVKHCLAATHLDSVLAANSVIQAMGNAQYLFEEFRKLIPEKSLDDYRSHCWATSYSTQWTNFQYSGHVGSISFGELFKHDHGHLVPILTRMKPQRKYQSDLVCLPNVFLAGFPKCGSTFMYCFMSKLIYFGTKLSGMNAEKEPSFWAAPKSVHTPTLNDLGGYLLNFLPGLESIQSHTPSASQGILVDGTPNLLFMWPHFTSMEHNLTNCCLLPSVLPKLLPNAKFVVIMRNPVDLLYSVFWYSCSRLEIKLSKSTLWHGPKLFHERVLSKINVFNECMRDMSKPSLRHVCELTTRNYSSCIRERLHLLDKCSHETILDSEVSECGRVRINLGLYYIHIRKWLSVVPREKFLYLNLEDIIQSPTKTAHDIFNFLDMKNSPGKIVVNKIMRSCDKNAQSAVNYKHNPHLKMMSDTKLMLEHFYAPFNSLLAEAIGSKQFLWR